MLMLRDHLSLVLAAMLLAVGLGVPLGLASYLYPKAGQVILRLVDLIQTTPALALLGVIMVAMGPGKPTVVVGLALYSLLPIVRNTSLGLSQVPAYLKEAGDGMVAQARALLAPVDRRGGLRRPVRRTAPVPPAAPKRRRDAGAV